MRTESFHAVWTDRNGNPLEDAGLVEKGGSIHVNSDATLKVGGQIQVHNLPATINVDQHRLLLSATTNEGLMGLGWYAIDLETLEYGRGSKVASLRLLDPLQVAEQWATIGPYACAAGTNPVVEAERILRERLGETRIATTPYEGVLTAPLVLEHGTSWLTIINELMGRANYWGLRTDQQGYFILAPYLLPEDRPIAHRFIAGQGSLMVSAYSVATTHGDIPNRFTLHVPAYGDEADATEDLYGVAENRNPASPSSIPARGGIIIDAGDQGEAATQKEADAIAARRLDALTNPRTTISVQHALTPRVWMDNAVYAAPSEGDPFTAVVDEMSITLTPGALVGGSWRKVVALNDS